MKNKNTDSYETHFFTFYCKDEW